MADRVEVVNSFQGVAKDVSPARLPPGLFQEDENGDRTTRRGSWKRRRGMRHTSLSQFDSPVTSMIGFEIPGGEFAMAIVEGNNIHGFTGVTAQVDSSSDAGDGFGEAQFGEGQFGE